MTFPYALPGPAKTIFKSMTFWGGLLMLASIVMSAFGVEFKPEEQAAMLDQGKSAAMDISAIAGFIMVLVGRWRANSPVKLLGLLLVPGLLAVTLASGGCSATPAKQWAQAREALTTAQDTALSLHAVGKLKDKDLLFIDPAVQAARAALTQASMYLPDGGKDFKAYLDIVQAVLVKLAQLNAQPAGSPSAMKENDDDGIRGTYRVDRAGDGTDQRDHQASAIGPRGWRDHRRAARRGQGPGQRQRHGLGRRGSRGKGPRNGQGPRTIRI